MDIRASLPPALTGVASAPGAPTADTGQAAALRGLATVVLDATGKASDGDKLSAYNRSNQLAVTGRFANLGPDDRRLLNQVGNSDTAQAVRSARAAYETKMMGAIQQARASGGSHGQALGAAALSHFDSLSSHDQNLLFSSLNAPDRTGATPFAGIADWRSQMAAMGGASTPVDRVELSDAAKAAMSTAQPAPIAAAPPSPYVAGSVADIRA
jgi:hypothetical protein